MSMYSQSTGNRLEGYNVPRGDRRKPTPAQHADGDYKAPDPALFKKPYKQKSHSGKARCLEVLKKYRTYVSHNDVALWTRYVALMQAAKIDVSVYGDEATRMYSHASVFRETLYFTLHDAVERVINAFHRGESYAEVHAGYLCLIITPITFHLSFTLKRRTDVGVF